MISPKHFAVHSGREPTRHFGDLDVSKHDEEDTYSPLALPSGRARGIGDVRLQRDQRRAWAPVNNAPDPVAAAAARNADVVVAVVGITSRVEGEEMPVDQPGFLGRDRTSLDLREPEEDLVQAVPANAKPVLVVLMNFGVNWEKAHADAILEAWYSGEEGSAAIAETLSGKNNPGGRLPVTFYKDLYQLPHFEDYSMKKRTN